jgi:hypothetical protein
MKNGKKWSTSHRRVDSCRARIITLLVAVGFLMPLLLNQIWVITGSSIIFWISRCVPGIAAWFFGLLLLFQPESLVVWAKRNLVFSESIPEPEDWTVKERFQLLIVSLFLLILGGMAFWSFYENYTAPEPLPGMPMIPAVLRFFSAAL